VVGIRVGVSWLLGVWGGMGLGWVVNAVEMGVEEVVRAW